MKILHINSYYYGSRFYKNLFDKQIEQGLDISVYVPTPLNHKLDQEGMGSYTTVSANHGKYDRFLFHLKHKKIYKDIINQYKIDNFSIVHAHSLFSNGYIAYKLKQRYEIPYIVAVRNTDINYFFKYMPHLRKIGLEILKEAKNIVFLSKGYQTEVVEKYVPQNLKESIYTKSCVIPNGIDDYWFNNIGSKKNKPTKKNLKLLYVGVINKLKNITTTIQAIEILQSKGYSIEFTVVGKILDKKIYNKIKNLSYLNYKTPKHREELIKIYRDNDIFIMPSISETFGLVYAESMSQGLPVIYTKGQGFDKQFEDGVIGFPVPSNSYQRIAEEVERILIRYEELSQNCIEKVKKFQWVKIEKQYFSYYSK